MIKNEREYRITHAAAEKFRAAIAAAEREKPRAGVSPKLHRVSIDGMRSQLADLTAQLEDYSGMKMGRPRLETDTSDRIGALLIKARIARNWTQRELGERVGLKMQQIQQYEATEYASASLTRIREILQALGAVPKIRLELIDLSGGIAGVTDSRQPALTIKPGAALGALGRRMPRKPSASARR